MQKRSNSKKQTLEVEVWGAAHVHKVAKAVEQEQALMQVWVKVLARPWKLVPEYPHQSCLELCWLEKYLEQCWLQQVKRQWPELEWELAWLEQEMPREQARLEWEQERLEQEQKRLKQEQTRLEWVELEELMGHAQVMVELVVAELLMFPSWWELVERLAEMKKTLVEMKKTLVEMKKTLVEMKKTLAETKKMLVEMKKGLAETLVRQARTLAKTLEVDLWTHLWMSTQVVEWAQVLAVLVEMPLVTYGEVLANLRLKNIIYSIEPDHCLHFAHHLWSH